ncbi:MAG: TolB family protein, partial [Gammaproteobacteria bacterium]
MRILFAFVSLCLPLAVMAAEVNPPFSIAQIYAEPGLTGYHPEQVQWSRDGKHLTYLLRHAPDGKADLHIVDTRSGDDRVLLTSEQLAGAAAPASSIKNERERDRVTRYHVDSYGWAPKSDALFFLSNDQVYLYTLDKGKTTQLTHAAGDKRDPKLSPDERWVSYLSDGDLHIVSVTGGAARSVAPHKDGILNGELDWVYTEELDLRTAY